jgi:purine-binding chemotaxis protein CheW
MNSSDILVFELDGQRFGVLASAVAVVCRMVRITILPKAPSIVQGVINFRGKLAPVLNIRARFGLLQRSVAHTDYLIIANAGTRLAAIPVEQVPEAGVGKLADGLVLVHNPESFLTQAEVEMLAEAISEHVG